MKLTHAILLAALVIIVIIHNVMAKEIGTVETTIKPTAESKAKLMPEATTKPIAESTTESTSKTVVKPKAESTNNSTTESAVKPTIKATTTSSAEATKSTCELINIILTVSLKSYIKDL